ncbi:hypothetical protein MTAT_12070 [Moorella thermoacetica]|uniref:DUF5668 domain-containing protein n=1 Tax=Neomoorella thermoacetica TaxID=1525 RepID=A0AAC9MUD1_NEOTH|nr:hypothetical protein [Moorella thermoacetica]AOQ23625.1 hypothetical protein Maut_01175 [Moorella thermoacetica]TYL13809.1 hypothetical protein MTAT_12070 [Moorella thermoacetica]
MQSQGKSIRQWRVGSFSTAVALILFGVATLVYRHDPGYVPQLINNWWPVVLILLGLEIFLAGYFCRDDVPRLKYDFLALILVLVIVIISLVIYVFNSSGLAARLTQALGAASYTVDLPEKRLAVAEGVQKIVVQGPGREWHNLQLRSGSSDDQIVFFGQAMVTATSEAEAREMARNAGLFTRQVGDTLFLELREVPLYQEFGPSARISGSTLILPAGLAVEVAGDKNGAGLEMVLDYLEADWSITNSGPIRVTLNRGINVQIEAYSRAAEMFQGNINWKIQNRLTSTASSDQKLPVPTYNQSEPEVMARATVGEGGPLLKLFSRDAIMINTR